MHISKPCHERYNSMRSSTGGRYCAVCSTTVVDFTKMNAGEIKTYFESHAGKNTCGRFKAEQVSSDVFYSRFLWSLKRGIEKHIRLIPFKLALLSLVSALFTFTGCMMGKAYDPGLSSKYKDNKDSTQVKAPADSTIQHH